jgi:hypothetical protein
MTQREPNKNFKLILKLIKWLNNNYNKFNSTPNKWVNNYNHNYNE